DPPVPPSERLGIAEGIETALAAARLFNMPVWAATNSTMLAKWQPPDCAREIVVFGDADPAFGGQAAAYALAHRLAVRDRRVRVQLPPRIGSDWADVLSAERDTKRVRRIGMVA
ncbi:toprim domain-containing protein, partial [Methylobacterium sp. R2-1]|uniref:toprim domain-containing protein n=1 Tax=Methylobacterium sp. R2-1 TaxID=2587064 RepID=UPI00161D4766